MNDLVTKDEVKAHLYIDGNDHDDWLAIAIPAASAAVVDWLKDEDRVYIGNDANNDIREPVRFACLVQLAMMFKEREGGDPDEMSVPQHWGYGYSLGVGATRLLMPYRKSTVA